MSHNNDFDSEENKKKILDEQEADKIAIVHFITVPEELKKEGVNEISFRGATLYVDCNGQSIETVLYRDNMTKTLEYFDESVNKTFSESAKQAIISHIKSVWQKDFHQDEHDPAADENRVKQIINLRVTDDDIKFVFDTMYEEAEHDKTSIEQIFLGMMSAATNKPIGHTVNSRKAGVGKSYLLNKVASYFPNKYVRILAGALNKSIFT